MRNNRYALKKKARHKKVKDKEKTVRVFPIVKYFSMSILLISLVIVLPLSLVGKQVYITNISINQGHLQDSLALLQREIVSLGIKIQKLSNTERIETIARESLGLDYPSSLEIIVVRPEKKKKIVILKNSPFWALIKKSIISKQG